MRKIIFFLAAFFTLAACCGPMVKVDKLEIAANLGDWTPDDVEVPGWVQGLIVSNGYAIIFHDAGQVLIYNLEKKEFVSSFYLPGNTSHCNNAALGLEKYSGSSTFPLIYVSDCVNKGDCYVYDMELSSAREVQRITLAEKPGGENGGNGWFIDEKNKKLGMHWNDSYYFFEIPNIYLGTESLSIKGLPASGNMNLPSTHQGACAWNGYIFFPCGFADDPYLTVVNIETKEHQNINLAELGIHNEPEGICEYNGSIYISCAKSAREALLYKMNLTFNR